jgi:hypothetical protein
LENLTKGTGNLQFEKRRKRRLCIHPVWVNHWWQELETRDGFGIWDTNSFDIKASTDAELLLMEIPMQH